MCVWAAYAGKKQAAPVVLEALKKIEGYWAGFYTGIATCANGRIHMEKCTGHTGIFEETFDLADFPGTIGMAHSRTNSGGGANRAHPFVGTEGKVALISQGSIGVFAPVLGHFTEVALQLYHEGRRMFSGSSTDGMRRIPEFVMPDGNQISLSDIVANAVEREYLKHGDVVAALRFAGSYLQEESCTVCIFADRPGVLGFINMNQRMGYCFEEDGVTMATSMAAFPGCFMEIPGNSVGYVTADGEFHREDLGHFPIKSHIPDGLAPAVLAYLKDHPGALLAHICDQAIRPLGFVRGELDYHSLSVYRTVEMLVNAGLIRYKVVFEPGETGIDGRTFRWYLK